MELGAGEDDYLDNLKWSEWFMAKLPVRTVQEGDVASRAKELFPLLDKLAATLKSDTRIFPSGIELFKFTLKAGSDYEFSIVIAGKDAPKVEDLFRDQK